MGHGRGVLLCPHRPRVSVFRERPRRTHRRRDHQRPPPPPEPHARQRFTPATGVGGEAPACVHARARPGVQAGRGGCLRAPVVLGRRAGDATRVGASREVRDGPAGDVGGAERHSDGRVAVGGDVG